MSITIDLYGSNKKPGVAEAPADRLKPYTIRLPIFSETVRPWNIAGRIMAPRRVLRKATEGLALVRLVTGLPEHIKGPTNVRTVRLNKFGKKNARGKRTWALPEIVYYCVLCDVGSDGAMTLEFYSQQARSPIGGEVRT